jgi:quercetin dioxygenase-like cupin family protein
MDHLKAGGRPTRFGPKEYFTGTVLQDPIIEAPEPARVRAARVTFLPGARTNWHTHPLGQALYVLSGVGRFQTWGQKAVTIRAGDTIWIPPGEKHWHGAAPETAMCHVAMHEFDGRRHIDWLEPVSDEDYAAQP